MQFLTDIIILMLRSTNVTKPQARELRVYVFAVF